MKQTITQASILVLTLTAVLAFVAVTDAHQSLTPCSGRSGLQFSAAVTSSVAATPERAPAFAPASTFVGPSLRPEKGVMPSDVGKSDGNSVRHTRTNRDAAPRVTGGGRSEGLSGARHLVVGGNDANSEQRDIEQEHGASAASENLQMRQADSGQRVHAPLQSLPGASGDAGSDPAQPLPPLIPVEQQNPAAYGHYADTWQVNGVWHVADAPAPARRVAAQSVVAPEPVYEWVLTSPITNGPPAATSIAWLWRDVAGSYGFGPVDMVPKTPPTLFTAGNQVQRLMVCFRGKDGKDIACIERFVASLPVTECTP